MKHATIAALLVTMSVITLSSSVWPEQPSSNPLAQKLWDTAPRDLAAVLVPWLSKPVFEPRSDVPELLWTAGRSPQFAKPTWKDHRGVIFDENGFRTILELEELPDDKKLWANDSPNHGFVFRSSETSDAEWGRELSCYKLKGDTSYDERRIFSVYRSAPEATLWFAASLRVFDSMPHKKSVGELLEHLRTRYGTFDALCKQIAKNLASGTKSE